MTHKSVTRILHSYRSGSSWPVLVEASDGLRYVMKWRGTAEGPAANAADMIALRLTRLVGIPVPTPHVLHLTAVLVHPKQDPELNDLIHRSVGTNLGIEEIPGTEPYHHERLLEVPPQLRALVYAFDVLFLNMDRTKSNPNLVFAQSGLLCWDFAAVMEVRMLLERRSLTENIFYPLLRRHPFYERSGGVPVRFPQIDAGEIASIVADVPDDWFAAETDRSSIAAGIRHIFVEAATILERRRADIDTTPLETDEERAARGSANRKAFEAAVDEITNRSSAESGKKP